MEIIKVEVDNNTRGRAAICIINNKVNISERKLGTIKVYDMKYLHSITHKSFGGILDLASDSQGSIYAVTIPVFNWCRYGNIASFHRNVGYYYDDINVISLLTIIIIQSTCNYRILNINSF